MEQVKVIELLSAMEKIAEARALEAAKKEDVSEAYFQTGLRAGYVNAIKLLKDERLYSA